MIATFCVSILLIGFSRCDGFSEPFLQSSFGGNYGDHNVNVAKLLNVSIVSWNLAEKQLPYKGVNFLSQFNNSDIVCIGVQECEDIRPRREEGRKSRALRMWQSKLLGKTYQSIARSKLGGKINVFSKITNRDTQRSICTSIILFDLFDILSIQFDSSCFIGIQLSIYMKKEHLTSVQGIQMIEVPCGIGTSIILNNRLIRF
jgi:hypothetical protein